MTYLIRAKDHKGRNKRFKVIGFSPDNEVMEYYIYSRSMLKYKPLKANPTAGTYKYAFPSKESAFQFIRDSLHRGCSLNEILELRYSGVKTNRYETDPERLIEFKVVIPR